MHVTHASFVTLLVSALHVRIALFTCKSVWYMEEPHSKSFPCLTAYVVVKFYVYVILSRHVLYQTYTNITTTTHTCILLLS